MRKLKRRWWWSEVIRIMWRSWHCKFSIEKSKISLSFNIASADRDFFEFKKLTIKLIWINKRFTALRADKIRWWTYSERFDNISEEEWYRFNHNRNRNCRSTRANIRNNTCDFTRLIEFRKHYSVKSLKYFWSFCFQSKSHISHKLVFIVHLSHSWVVFS